ncbi:MAG: alpha/beta family hydrolase [Candidatus Thorarchaeota archaeon]
MYSFGELNIDGHIGRVPNEYLRLKEGTNRYAITFPGRGYTTQAPLLYYTNRFLLYRGINVLNINYDYMDNEAFETKSQEEKMEWLKNDVVAAYTAAQNQLDEQLCCLVGKSLGTIALAYILEESSSARDAKFIWHTPLILLPEIRRALNDYTPDSLFLIGTKDPYYDENVLSELIDSTGGESLVIESANHGMEVSTNPLELLEVMERVIQSLTGFFSSE